MIKASRWLFVASFCSLSVVVLRPLPAQACVPTNLFRDGFYLTAELVNPTNTVTGIVDAHGCNIAVYFNSGSGKIDQAEIYGSNYFGVVVDGNASAVSVDITNSSIHDIGESPFNGAEHGVAVYYVGYFPTGGASGTLASNTISNYQKGGIAIAGQSVSVDLKYNKVTGLGPVDFIAQNGIEIGFGAGALVTNNTVSGNSYTGSGSSAAGIVVNGGPYFGLCPDGSPCPYTTGLRITRNIGADNDVGVFLANLDSSGNAPSTPTSIRASNNTLSNNGLNNDNGGTTLYQAGVSDTGNSDVISNNSISGLGYNPSTMPGQTFAVDTSAAIQAKVRLRAIH